MLADTPVSNHSSAPSATACLKGWFIGMGLRACGVAVLQLASVGMPVVTSLHRTLHCTRSMCFLTALQCALEQQSFSTDYVGIALVSLPESATLHDAVRAMSYLITKT